MEPNENQNRVISLGDDLPPPEFERTLLLIKPNAISKAKAIESIVKKEKFFVLHRRRMYLKPTQARDFYIRAREDEDAKRYYELYQELIEADKARNPRYKMPVITIEDVEEPIPTSDVEEFVDFMTSGPVEILVLGGRGAVAKLVRLMGPEDPRVAREIMPDSIRAKFGGESILRNAVHGSETHTQAEKEIRFFFPEAKFDTESKLGASGEYLSKTVNPILLKGLIQLCRQKPDNPLVWLADWLLANNPNTKP
ncbi:nucleoside diphosphate kinase homolog 5-like [Stegodyphus dumicola]|uniref:nucleoside diphosphate kinase homolog 5-like n=1 Tax=Stegodyphus dumicola TaxID=202533 RepID=UPI0015AFB146|nr:nucleoside diphosphate kinase homolog 5-like [Stegodyphus dumicola]